MPVRPNSFNSMEIDGAIFDTANVSWNSSTHGKVLIADGFPFPINSELSVNPTNGDMVKLYTFNLLTIIHIEVESLVKNIIVNDDYNIVEENIVEENSYTVVVLSLLPTVR